RAEVSEEQLEATLALLAASGGLAQVIFTERVVSGQPGRIVRKVDAQWQLRISDPFGGRPAPTELASRQDGGAVHLRQVLAERRLPLARDAKQEDQRRR